MSHFEVTLKEFYTILARHDWYYMYSDDPSYYRAGEASSKRLQAIAQNSQAHKDLLNAWSKHMFSGPSWGTERAPLPEIPKE